MVVCLSVTRLLRALTRPGPLSDDSQMNTFAYDDDLMTDRVESKMCLCTFAISAILAHIVMGTY